MGYKCLYQKRRIQKYYCFFFFTSYRARKLLSYGDKEIEALPPESEGP